MAPRKKSYKKKQQTQKQKSSLSDQGASQPDIVGKKKNTDSTASKVGTKSDMSTIGKRNKRGGVLKPTVSKPEQLNNLLSLKSQLEYLESKIAILKRLISEHRSVFPEEPKVEGSSRKLRKKS